MPSLNKVMLIGRLGQNPEKKMTKTGKPYVKVSLATNQSFTDRDGNKVDKTEWHNLVLWNKIAELVASSCVKGSLLYVEGSIYKTEWTDKDNIKRNNTEINVQSFQFMDTRATKPTINNREFEKFDSPDAVNQLEETTIDQLEDDIPF